MATATKTTRLEARVTPSVLASVKRAAELQGRSVSAFVTAAAEEMARKTIDEAHTIRLSLDDQQRFAALLLDPPPVSEGLRRAKEAHSRLTGNSTNAAIPD